MSYDFDNPEEEEECAYCGRLGLDWDFLPSVYDDISWGILATEHFHDCEWVTTRAHQLPRPEENFVFESEESEDGPFYGFRALYGHDPIAGEDFDPDGFTCQDDYEYFTSTGRYTKELNHE